MFGKTIVSEFLGSIGEKPSATDTDVVDGAGLTWSNSSNIRVGRLGTGILSITGDGIVMDTNSYIRAGGSAIAVACSWSASQTATGAGIRNEDLRPLYLFFCWRFRNEKVSSIHHRFDFGMFYSV